jgi:hypothetical protein
MLFPRPARTSRYSYDGLRRDSHNFELYGENHVAEDTPREQRAPVLDFPSATDSWITVNIHRKDSPMTDAQREGDNAARQHTSHSDLERVATYSTSGPLHVLASTTSGDITVRATDSSDVTVTLRASSPKYAYLLDAADIDFDSVHHTLSIRTVPKGISFSSRGLRIGPASSWFDAGSSDLDVLVEVPRGTALEVSTVTGDTALHGALGNVAVKSVSGDVDAQDTFEALDVQTASGDVRSGHVLTSLKCKSASGDVVCQGAATNTEIFSASGDILLSADHPGKIVVRNVSGDVTVRVTRGLAVDINGDTLSGSMGSNIDLNGDGGDSDDDVVIIKVTTVSGDIRIDKAS